MTRESQRVRFGGDCEGVLYLPRETAPAGAVVVLHERYGLVQHTLDLAARLAHDGYVALAPHLFSRWKGDVAALRGGGGRGGRARRARVGPPQLPHEALRRHAARLAERHHAGALPRERGEGSLGPADPISRRRLLGRLAGRRPGALGIRERNLRRLRFFEKHEAGVIERLDPARTALLFFDMLNGHVKKNDAATKSRYSPVIAAAVRLLDAARRSGIVVMYAAAHHRADNATTAHLVTDTDNRLRPIPAGRPSESKPVVAAGTWEAQVIDELKPQPLDYMIPKFRWSAFHQTYLDLALRSRNIDTLVISGGSTDVGVASTAYAARDLDYHLVVVSDACTSPEADNHAQFMRRVFPRIARVRTADEVVRMLGG